MRFDKRALQSAVHGQGVRVMPGSQQVAGYDDTPTVEQGVDATEVLSQIMSQQAHLSAAIRQISSRLTNVEQAAGALNSNHQEIAKHVNALKDGLSTVAKATTQQMKILQAYGRGSGVRPAQYVPARASDTVIAYDTPPRGMERAIDIMPASGPTSGSEPVDPGTSDADDTQISMDDAVFYGLVDDDDD